ncbi:hypothetical protein ACP275_11G077800 [Erythranthe tilingii]
MHYTMSKLLLQTLLISIIIVQTVSSCFLTRKITVKVVDNLPQNSPPLFLHCASGDKELGNHTLTTGQDFQFHFCVNAHTLYFCHLWWNGKQKAFDVFNNDWPSWYCADKVCYWEARSDGIYNSKNYPPGDLDKKYDWDNA